MEQMVMNLILLTNNKKRYNYEENIIYNSMHVIVNNIMRHV